MPRIWNVGTVNLRYLTNFYVLYSMSKIFYKISRSSRLRYLSADIRCLSTKIYWFLRHLSLGNRIRYLSKINNIKVHKISYALDIKYDILE